MKVLLDECLPRKLKYLLKNHQVQTVPEAGWAGKSNGELIALAKGKYDVFVTIDKTLISQHNLKIEKLSVIILSASSNRLEVLKPLMPEVLEVLHKIKAGKIVTIK